MNIETVNELIASLESAGELSIREQKFLKLAKAHVQLAAENVGLKESVEHAAGCIAAAEAEGLIDALAETTDERLADLVHRRLCHAYLEVETPATSAYLAGIRADALPGNIAEIIDSGDLETICYESERSYAEDFRLALYNFRQLREGAK
ncbi:hypothetical protein ACXEHY_004548 [Klebsiella pneumoniae]